MANHRVRRGLLFSALLSALVASAVAQSPPHPGKALYDRACAACHDHPETTRAPAFANLRGMRYGTMHFAITEGKMAAQGAGLSDAERGQLLDFIVGREVLDESWIDAMMCPAERRKPGSDVAPTVAGFGFEAQNHRHLSREQAGLGTADMGNLELAWAMAFPKVTTMRAQAAVVGNTLFVPVTDAARLFAIDISVPETPCFKWVYKSELPLRTGAAYGVLPGSGRKVLAFGDAAVRMHVIDAGTGEELWHQSLRLTGLSNSTGTPIFHGDKLYVPISNSEINFGHDPKHECCTTHGAVYALDAATGRKIWTYHTMAEAKPIRDRGDGQMMWGPSGAPIWNSPSIDAKRGVLYVGTGEANSAPAAPTTDAILAIDLNDGRLRWKFQATPGDIFLTGCMTQPNLLNCPREGKMLDVDFGASTILARRPGGKDIVLAGQKSSTLWALDAAHGGKLLWKRNFGPGSITGGIHWGIAYDGERVFAPISIFPDADGIARGGQIAGLHAVDVATGKVVWSYEPKPDCSGDRPTHVRQCQGGIGLSGAPTVIDGAVLSGSIDGFLRAFDARTGKLLFQYDTSRPYQGVNGIDGHGGAIDNASIVAANGMVFVNSGYGLFANQTPGNVLLAFRPKRAAH